jgi:hypothetical protein
VQQAVPASLLCVVWSLKHGIVLTSAALSRRSDDVIARIAGV